jgi:MFS transporter, CP family, cyanate transporter
VASPPDADRSNWGRLALLWLAGADLRMTLLAVPPLLPLIHAELGLDEKGVAALSSLPVLLLGLGAVPGSLLVARIGPRRALIAGLLLVACSAVLRGVGPFIPLLFAMTLLMGVGIAISQPTILALVRQWFPSRVTRATGAWSSGLLIGELLGASLTLPVVLPLVDGSWEIALAVWAIPVVVTAALIAVATRQPIGDSAPARASGWPDWRQARVWQLGLLQSSASLVYFGANTFLPDYLHVVGQPDLVGLALTAVNSAQVPAAPLVGLLPWRLLVHRGTIVLGGVLMLAGVAGLLSQQPALIVGAGALLGFLSAYVLVVCFAIPPLLSRETDVARLSAGANTISYSVAFASNLLAGALWDATQIPASGFLPVLFGAGVVLVVGPRLIAASAAELTRPTAGGSPVSD